LIASPLLVLGHNVTANPALVFLLVPIETLFFLDAFVYSIYISLRLSLAFSACVHENLTARQSIILSGAFTRGAKGRIFLVLLVIYALSYTCLMVTYSLVGILVFAIGAAANLGDIQHASPLAVAMIALASLFALAVFSSGWLC
jgi:membrane-anchored glycerophosphoryl diester phosphodiesterase (GDPDase)